MRKITGQADIGLIGLAVMGQNLILNMNDKGFCVAVYNRTTSKVDEFLAAAGRDTLLGAHSIAEFVGLLKRPRKIMLMIRAGSAVDSFIETLKPHLERGDIIVDGGNSNFMDTIRRTTTLATSGLYYVGSGVSGGEEGARNGPSLMPGGNYAAWKHIAPIFQAIAARTSDGEPCCDWIGADGSGHFVKMVHNGIEYGDMQIIAEAYHLMQVGLGMKPDDMHRVFERWNHTELDSYLVEITRDIMAVKGADGVPVLEVILDAAGQKGTGKWTGMEALDLGIPVTLIVEAVFARALSALKEERVAAAQILRGPESRIDREQDAFVEDIRRALLASKIISYAQGFMQIAAAASEHNWQIDLGAVANMWRGGCIIRSVFLGDIRKAFQRNPNLKSLILDDYFRGLIDGCQESWRRVVSTAALSGIPTPAFASALSFYDGYRSARLPANLIQAQRDYFGAHTYERIDRPRGEFVHTNWTGTGGETSASSYNA